MCKTYQHRPLMKASRSSVPNLSYIWSITGIETGQVIMVLKQEGENLYGQAKYEPDSGQSWNGVVIGSVEGNRVDLVLNSQNGTEETANPLNRKFRSETGQSIKGDLIKVSNGQITERSGSKPYGSTRIYPAIHRPLYRIPKAATTASSQEDQNTTPRIATENSLPYTTPPKSYYHDVRQDADRILTGVGDISQIPIGMGGSGLS